MRGAEEQSIDSSSSVAAVRDVTVSEVQKAQSRVHAADEPPRPLPDTRAASMQRFLNSQKNVDQEVLQLYKLVCRG